ncbi:hypothetical protein RhiJN_14087 [Ceratobasidium sp. AG-Ba]|nr:hypothetical protein RhiJN_14087 [Ceratobasidium sp. AG-Ba]QRW14639.1 hypothetical protein RhiLY_13638 [Ceratobasidium sp. AG-Ba]
MFGTPDASANYSLSGHLALSLETPAPTSIYEKPETVYLSSLELVFEGKAEMVSSQAGYDGFRICRITKQLVPEGRRIVLTTESDPHRQAGSSSATLFHQWEVLFDLQLPGWLPPTTECGEDGGGTSYALYATASFADSEKYSSWSLSSLYSLVRTRQPPVEASRVPIELTRHRSPPFNPTLELSSEQDAPLFPPIDHPATTTIHQATSDIPIDLLRSLDIIATVPQHIGCEEKRVPVSLRVRSSVPGSSNLGSLRLDHFEIQLNQTEKFSSRPMQQYVNAFPVPPEAEQPPFEPLRDPHQWHSLYALGLVVRNDAAVGWTRLTHLVAGDRVRFKPSAGGLELNDDWAKMDTTVSIDPTTRKSHPKPKGARQLVPTVFTPYLRVKHELRIGLNLTYIPPESASNRTPIRQMAFATAPLSFTVTSLWPFGTSSGSSSPASTSSAMSMTPYLPAYSQLFHDNGERREDLLGGWLPQYCEQADGVVDFPASMQGSPVSSSA